MKQDMVICGVGGQGILSIAYVLDHSAQESGFHFKQPEVHGMAQRGGAVHAQLRMGDQPVASGLIPAGTAELLLSLEPMESLRYLAYLSPQAVVVTDIHPHVNIADYPEPDALFEVLLRIPGIRLVDGGYLARKAGLGRAQNMVILGAATPWLPFAAGLLAKHISALFGTKDQRVLQANLKAFQIGQSVGCFYRFMSEAALDSARIARVAARLDFDSVPPTPTLLEAWRAFLADQRSDPLARRIFSAGCVLPLRADIPKAIIEGTAVHELACTVD